MKLKQRPDDFRVEERPAVGPSPAGPFAFYQMEKRGQTTPDALAAVQRRWRIDPRRVSFGGLKDRHAHTVQFLTIHHGPPRDLTLGPVAVTYLGRRPEPYTSDQVRANGFALTLRGLAPAELARAEAALPEVADAGVANYFDDQRFGSVGDGWSFVGREMVLGHFGQALRLALVAPYPHDRPAARHEKATLAAHWGDWAACRAGLPPGHARDVVTHLRHRPGDFRGACARLRPELRGLYLSAWQSHLWNRMLARWLTDHLPSDQLIRIHLKTGGLPMPRAVPAHLRAEWEGLALPLPSARLKFDPAAPWASVVAAVTAEEGIPLDRMRVPGLHKPFFSKGDRAGRVPVSGLAWSAADDERAAGRRKLDLRFELPRGCYATMVVKRLTAGA